MKHLLFLLLLVSSECFAFCHKTGQTCIDNTPCKTQYGVEICLESLGKTCWAYQDAYDCTTCGELTTSYCDPLAGMGCFQSDTPVCTSYDQAGTCLNTANTYRCDNSVDQLPPGVTYIGVERYIKSDTIKNNCIPQELNKSCSLKSEVCVEPAGTRNINGMLVTKECWKWERTYACLGEMDKSDCVEIQSDPSCSLTKTTCNYMNPDTHLCEVYEKIYSCRDGEDKTQTYTDCQGKVTCIGSYCFDSSYPPDEEFNRSTAMMEAAREAGIYDLKGIFGGEEATCHKDSTVGIDSSCCDVTTQGDTSNRNHYGANMSQVSLGGTAASNFYNYMGSSYVHDFLFANSLVPEELLNKAFGMMGGNSFSVGVTYYGVTVNFAVVDGSLKMGYSFNPWLLAAQLALQFILEVMNCEMSQEEQMLSLRRGSGLCHFVGSWTEKSTFSKTTYETYCCFNSKLALLINQQGRNKLGKPWGTAKEPKCDGFSEGEISSINFDSIDFSSFYGEIVPLQMNTSNTQTIISDNVNCVAEDNGYDRATNANCNRDYKPGVVRDLPVLQFETN
jgi:conjugal transfer mating pair stabilization protein TraN